MCIRNQGGGAFVGVQNLDCLYIEGMLGEGVLSEAYSRLGRGPNGTLQFSRYIDVDVMLVYSDIA